MVWFVLILLISLVIPAGSGEYKLLTPRQAGGKIITYQQNDIPPGTIQFRSMICQRNLLGLERETPFGPAIRKNGIPITLAIQADTIRILALKIEFQTEDPDDPTTTGNGNFDLRSLDQFVEEEGHDFDPAPHNTSYFSSHLEALHNYWWFVSDKTLNLEWDIYPQEETLSFRLPNPISYYGSETSWGMDSIVVRLERFFKDAVKLADTLAPEINFSDYQSVILFHAGSDQQNNIAFINDTPFDLWTGFIKLAEPVCVDSNGAGWTDIPDGLIVPETVSQDNRVGVLNAVLAHEFGHQLGLVDLYNTYNFQTAVGDFSLMDNNGLSVSIIFEDDGPFVTGVLPVYPDAWSRAYLGFSAVREIADGQNVVISAAEQYYHDDEIVKVPISEMEYFLIENRQRYADFDYIHYDPSIPNAIIADSTTGVILGPGWAYYDNNELYKVLTGEYDRLLPGDGVLIWHVDETVAYMDYVGEGGNNFLQNTLQWDPNRRFVSVVEADGIVDLGDYNYFSGYGTDDDFFKIGNNTDFTPSTNPDTRSNLGADTHISITGITETDTLMYCDISIGWNQDGFPVMGFPDLGNNCDGLLVLDIDSDGQNEILTGVGKFLIAVNPDGSPVMDTSSGLLIPGFDGDSLIYVLPVFAILDTNITGNLIAGDFDGDDSLEVACCDILNKLYIFEGYDRTPLDSLADLLVSETLSASLTAGPVAYDIDNDNKDELIVGFDDSSLHLIDISDIDTIDVTLIDDLDDIPIDIAISDEMTFVVYGSSDNFNLYVRNHGENDADQQHTISLPDGHVIGIVCGDIDRDGFDDAVVTVGDYLCIYNGQRGTIKTINIESPGPPSLADINSDGYPEIIFTGGNDCVYVYNNLEVLFDGFPVRLPQSWSWAMQKVETVIADVDADNNPDILVCLPDGGLACYNYHGDMLGGFPLPTSTRITMAPIVSDIDADGDIEVAAMDSAGFVSVWDLETSTDSINLPWPMAGGGIGHRCYLSPAFDKDISIAEGFLPEAEVYNYPNPATDMTCFRYYVDRQAEVNIKIFDMSGELVDELKGSSPRGGVNEVSWDCSEFASGVYFARLEASSPDIKKNVIVKVALIK